MSDSQFTNEEKEQFRKEYETTGVSLTELGNRVGVRGTTMAKYIRSVGGEVRGRGRPKGSKTKNRTVVSEPDVPETTSDPIVIDGSEEEMNVNF